MESFILSATVVIINSTQELAEIRVLGSNYVIVETNDNKRYRKWLDDISVEEN